MTARVCIFCGNLASNREHAFPDWLNDVFRPEEIGKGVAR
jgi:hypothetical protein